MTITTPATFGVVTQQALASAAFADSTLDTILKRLNYAWRKHRPQLVAIAPTVESMTRNTEIEFGVEPSADGLLYAFDHQLWIGANGTIAIEVEEWDGVAWATIYGPAGGATVGGAWHVASHTATISASARRLRITYDHGVAAYWVADIAAYPAPTTTPSTKQVSGWVAYDDGLLASTGAPIHAELLNRCKSSAAALLVDRKQMVLSFAQDRTNPRYDGQVTQPPGSVYDGSQAMVLGRGRLHLPGNAGPAVVSLHVHGSATGAGSRTLLVRHLGGTLAGSSQSFTLDDTWRTADLTVVGESPEVELLILNTDTTGVGKAMVDSVVGFWTPGELP